MSSQRPPDSLPWRGPGPGRPVLPPESMPPFWRGRLRKRWRYVAAFDEELMICAARVEIGPLGQQFWAVWDRGARHEYEHTRMRPGGREVVLDGSTLEINHRDVRARFRLGRQAALETICPSGD